MAAPYSKDYFDYYAQQSPDFWAWKNSLGDPSMYRSYDDSGIERFNDPRTYVKDPSKVYFRAGDGKLASFNGENYVVYGDTPEQTKDGHYDGRNMNAYIYGNDGNLLNTAKAYDVDRDTGFWNNPLIWGALAMGGAYAAYGAGGAAGAGAAAGAAEGGAAAGAGGAAAGSGTAAAGAGAAGAGAAAAGAGGGAAGGAAAGGAAAGSGFGGWAGYAGTAASLIGSAMQSSAAGRAADAQVGAARDANDTQRYTYDTTRSDLAPWMDAGRGALNKLTALTSGGTNTAQTILDQDPGYQFRLSEGEKGINRSAASQGGLLSGATQKALAKYNQDYASNEFGNTYNRLASLAGIGQTAVNSAAGAGQNYANNVSQNQLGIGNARAASAIGSANAWGNGLSNAYNGYQTNQLYNAYVNRLNGRNGGGSVGNGGWGTGNAYGNEDLGSNF